MDTNNNSMDKLESRYVAFRGYAAELVYSHVGRCRPVGKGTIIDG